MQNEKITSIIYRNSHDCGEGLIIKFENILKVISELSDIGSEVFSLAHFPLNGLVHINGEEYNITKKVLEPEKPGYEIMSFEGDKGKLWLIDSHGNYYLNIDRTYSLAVMIEWAKSGTISIHSVKRLSDEEVFMVRESHKHLGNILEFKIDPKGMSIRCEESPQRWRDLHYIDRKFMSAPTPTILLTTENGVEITDAEQVLYGIDKVFNGFYKTTAKNCNNKDVKYFSTKVSREEYILYNKPVTVTIKEFLDSNLSPIIFFKSKQNNG